MRIEGFDVTYLSSYDGLPVKNHLPVELRERFKTENQWLESGYVLVVGAVGLEMHPTAVSRTLCTYYLDTAGRKNGKKGICIFLIYVI